MRLEFLRGWCSATLVALSVLAASTAHAGPQDPLLDSLSMYLRTDANALPASAAADDLTRRLLEGTERIETQALTRSRDGLLAAASGRLRSRRNEVYGDGQDAHWLAVFEREGQGYAARWVAAIEADAGPARRSGSVLFGLEQRYLATDHQAGAAPLALAQGLFEKWRDARDDTQRAALSDPRSQHLLADYGTVVGALGLAASAWTPLATAELSAATLAASDDLLWYRGLTADGRTYGAVWLRDRSGKFKLTFELIGIAPGAGN